MLRLERVILMVAAAATLVTARPARLVAQDTTGAGLDSLLERLESAERAIERMRRQLEELDQAKVGTFSRNRVELSGLILMNGFHTDKSVNNSDVPTFVAGVQDSSGLPNGYIGAQVRQSRLGLRLTGPQALGADLSADIELDFYGGQPNAVGARPFPVPRIRTASARLDWRRVGVLVGQESQVISPWNPVSFASIGIPGFTHAGNLWFWLPQVRLTYQAGARPILGFQAAVVAPNLGFGPASFAVTSGADNAEKSGRPFVQGRVFAGWGDGDALSQVGIGVHRGWIATAGDSTLSSEAFSADWRVALGSRATLLGEAYSGAAVGSLGGGGIAQGFGVGGVPVDSRGGWVQLNVRLPSGWELGAGWGFDDPDDADLPATGRLRNNVAEGHLHWRPGGGLLLGIETRRIETAYSGLKEQAWHVNGFAGVAF